MTGVTSNFDTWWALAVESFWITALARAGGDERLARDWYLVGIDWIAGLQVRWRRPEALLN